MATKTKQAPFTTIKFEREPEKTKSHRLYAVEKTEYGTFKLFIDDEVLEAKHLFHGTHDKIAADGPLRSSANLDDRFFAYCNDWLFALPDDLCADRIFFLRRCSPEGLKRRLCTHLNSNKILSAPVNADQVSLSPDELTTATLLAKLDVPIYEIQTKDDQSWIVELLQPRPYTPAEAKKYLPVDTATKPEAGDDSDMLTTPHAAAFANVSIKTILNWTDTRDQHKGAMLPGARLVAGKWLIPRGDLKPFVKAERTRTEPPKKTKKPTFKNPVKK